MERILVSGIGIVCPGAIGREEWVRTISTGPATGGVCRVPDFALEAYLVNARSFRRAAAATKFALAAMALAITDAGFSAGGFGGERAGLIVGITHGAVTYSVEFHRALVREGPLAASPLYFSESVPNALAGNGAIAFQVHGPVHTLIGEEPVGTQAIDLAANLLHGGLVDRCLVVGAEEWNEVVAHAYAQVDRATRRKSGSGDAPPLGEGAAALVLELENTVARRGVIPRAVISGWSLGRSLAESVEDVAAEALREAFRATSDCLAEVDHVLPSTGRFRSAATRAIVRARSAGADPRWVDLLPFIGNPAGATNLLQVATSASLITAGKVSGPGLTVTTGIEGTVSIVVLAVADGVRAQRWLT
jgi:3-oxoacyl-[acyl-carrier-protein] synthase II